MYQINSNPEKSACQWMKVGHGLEFLFVLEGNLLSWFFNPVSIPRCKMDGPHDMERCQRLGKLAQGSDGASLNGSEQTHWFLVLDWVLKMCRAPFVYNLYTT